MTAERCCTPPFFQRKEGSKKPTLLSVAFVQRTPTYVGTHLIDVRTNVAVLVELDAVSVVVPPAGGDRAPEHPAGHVVLPGVAALPAPTRVRRGGGEKRVGTNIIDD